LPLAGYVAVAKTIDLSGILLFIILKIWQKPHYYAIGIYRLNDYKQAKIQILPVKCGIAVTKNHMFAWSMLFLVVIFLPYVYGFVGIIYLVPTAIIFILWAYLAIKGFFVQDDIKWAKQTFFLSILSLTTFCLSIIFDVLI
jgi:protoheme IX farnesyltransferase